ncbi:MAG: hypothetical protein J2P13_12800 [Acidobacteria bacterium]|nr:hypothetical protein [Acidobacteriota bacterium]
MAQRIYILPDKENQEAGWPQAADISYGRRESTKPVAARAREALKDQTERAQDAVRRARIQFTDTARTTIKRIRRVADERPLHFVAGIAGAAFALGVVLRIWRSKQHA